MQKGVHKYNQTGFHFNDIETNNLTLIGNLQLVIGGMSSGYVLTSDANGVATWSAPQVVSDTNIANADLTATQKRIFTILDNSLDSFVIRTITKNNLLQLHTINGSEIFHTSANFRVSGNAFTIESNTVKFSTNIVEVNTSQLIGNPTINFELRIYRGALPNARFIWDETDDKFKITENSSNYYRILDERDYDDFVSTSGDTVDGHISLQSTVSQEILNKTETINYQLYADTAFNLGSGNYSNMSYTSNPSDNIPIANNTVQTFSLKVYSLDEAYNSKITKVEGMIIRKDSMSLFDFKGSLSYQTMLEDTDTTGLNVTLNLNVDFTLSIVVGGTSQYNNKWSGEIRMTKMKNI